MRSGERRTVRSGHVASAWLLRDTTSWTSPRPHPSKGRTPTPIGSACWPDQPSAQHRRFHHRRRLLHRAHGPTTQTTGSSSQPQTDSENSSKLIGGLRSILAPRYRDVPGQVRGQEVPANGTGPSNSICPFCSTPLKRGLPGCGKRIWPWHWRSLLTELTRCAPKEHQRPSQTHKRAEGCGQAHIVEENPSVLLEICSHLR